MTDRDATVTRNCDRPLTDAELAEIEARTPTAASGDGWTFRMPCHRTAAKDVHAPSAGDAFVLAIACGDIHRLLAELRRLRAERDQADGEAAGWQSRYESLLGDKIKAYYDLKAANAEIDRLRRMVDSTQWATKA